VAAEYGSKACSACPAGLYAPSGIYCAACGADDEFVTAPDAEGISCVSCPVGTASVGSKWQLALTYSGPMYGCRSTPKTRHQSPSFWLVFQRLGTAARGWRSNNIVNMHDSHMEAKEFGIKKGSRLAARVGTRQLVASQWPPRQHLRTHSAAESKSDTIAVTTCRQTTASLITLSEDMH
jgi:hypothetical protein